MKRIYSNYSDEEFALVEKEAQKLGVTISTYCKMAIMEKVAFKGACKGVSTDLIKKLNDKLENLEPGKLFIVADLFESEEWYKLTRSEKNTISKQLAKKVRECTDEYCVNAILAGKITQYKKI